MILLLREGRGGKTGGKGKGEEEERENREGLGEERK